MALDPIQVDPKHYEVEFENNQVRVLRIKYGPHEKSAMHGHPPTVLVFLTDGYGRFTLPDGRIEERSWQAGQTAWDPGGQHLPENLSDLPLEAVLVELKSQSVLLAPVAPEPERKKSARAKPVKKKPTRAKPVKKKLSKTKPAKRKPSKKKPARRR